MPDKINLYVCVHMCICTHVWHAHMWRITLVGVSSLSLMVSRDGIQIVRLVVAHTYSQWSISPTYIPLLFCLVLLFFKIKFLWVGLDVLELTLLSRLAPASQELGIKACTITPSTSLFYEDDLVIQISCVLWLLFETDSHVVYTDLKLALWPSVSMQSSDSSSVIVSVIAGVYHHAQFNCVLK